MRWLVSTLALLIVVNGLVAQSRPKAPVRDQPVVIPFDFESKFDGGSYGQDIGDMIWKKLQRRGRFVIPDSMIETRQWCERHKFNPSPDTPLERLKNVVIKEQAGDIAVWGKIERVPGFDTDVYDLWIMIADFSVEPAKMIHQKKVRTRTASEIPHTYVKEALNALYGGPEKVASVPLDPAIVSERWQKGPNLLKGDFEKGNRFPLGWDPLPRHVSWVREQGSGKSNGIVRFAIPPDVAETTGVLYYSDYFSVEAGATYRFQCRWRTSGTAVKVFVKCYDEVQGPFRGKDNSTERREVYRSQQNLAGPSGRWNLHEEDFTPKHTQFTPRWGRVMLYGYYPAGTVEWDDVVLKQISAPQPRRGDPRPSLETKVRTKDIK